MWLFDFVLKHSRNMLITFPCCLNILTSSSTWSISLVNYAIFFCSPLFPLFGFVLRLWRSRFFLDQTFAFSLCTATLLLLFLFIFDSLLRISSISYNPMNDLDSSLAPDWVYFSIFYQLKFGFSLFVVWRFSYFDAFSKSLKSIFVLK